MKQFEKVEVKRNKRSAFDLSHERKTTFDMGKLIPVTCLEVLPGDRLKVNFEAFLKTLPLLSPVMHRVNIYAHAFFVPNRLLFPKTNGSRWEDFITGVGGTMPVINNSQFNGGTYPYTIALGDLFDHLDYGLRVGTIPSGNMSQLALRAYWRIYDEYYRDQNQIASIAVQEWPTVIDNTVDYRSFYAPATRAWEKDYFTASLPTQQRGGGVTLGLSGPAPVKGKDQRTGVANDAIQYTPTTINGNPAAGSPAFSGTDKYLRIGGAQISVYGNLEADLSAAGPTITSLRQAFALQRWYEASMRFGQRYYESLLGLFGLKSKDSRLQRAEFVGGGKLPVIIGEVLQTSRSDAGATPQGTMVGRGLSQGGLFHTDRTFDEHGIFMIIVSVIPRTSYMNWAAKFNFKTDKFDFAFPQLAHISEQPVYVKELFNTNIYPSDIFGYQPQYSDYRYIPDSVHGQFKGTLKFWGLTREFTTVPALNKQFVECVPRTDIWPVASTDQLLLQSFTKVLAIRQLPKFGTPY